MKAFKYIMLLVLSVFMLEACTSDEQLNVPVDEGNGNIHFRVAGVSASSTRADLITAEENESRIESLLVVLFDANKGFYKTIEAIPTDASGGYVLKVDKDGEYNMVFVANADNETRKSLENLETKDYGNSLNTVDLSQQIRSVVTDKAPDSETFVMVSSGKYGVNTSIMGKKDIGTVTLMRLSARFDIVNLADGIKVTKITFTNRSVKSNLWSPNQWQTDENWFDEKSYEPDDLVGSSDIETAGQFRHEIYSYRNLSTEENGSRPLITIEYEEIVENGKVEKREHVIEFNDPNSSVKSPLAISANRLYTITLKKAHNLNFEVTVSDWEIGDDLGSSDLRLNDLNIPSELQKQLNDALMVNRFTEYNVKTLDLSAKTVEMFDVLSFDLADYPTENNGSYFSYRDLKDAGLVSNDPIKNIITDKTTGEKYRIPTAGELGLLFPYVPNFFDPNFVRPEVITSSGTALLSYAVTFMTTSRIEPYKTNILSARVRQENLPFKNNDDGTPRILNSPGEEEDGFYSAESMLAFGSNYHQMYLNSASPRNYTSDTSQPAVTMLDSYMVRFKGTSQYAAYKYEVICQDGDLSKPYASVKIKALPKDSNISVYDIVDNDEYWSKDFIEFKFPFLGVINNGTRGEAFDASVLSSSVSFDTKSMCSSGFRYQVIGSTKMGNTKMPIRLIKVNTEQVN